MEFDSPWGLAFGPVVYNLLSSTQVRTRPPAHTPRTPGHPPSPCRAHTNRIAPRVLPQTAAAAAAIADATSAVSDAVFAALLVCLWVHM